MVLEGQNKLFGKIGFPSLYRFAYEFNKDFIGQIINMTQQIGKERNVALLSTSNINTLEEKLNIIIS